MFETMKVKSHKGTYKVEINDKINFSFLHPNDFVIVDKNISNLYPKLLFSHPKSKIYEFTAIEENKTVKQCLEIIDVLTTSGFKRNHKIVAIGGGITQDVAGFISSVLYRGVEWQFVPTTLLSQTDSCVGGKTSINYNGAKNILGTFYPPKRILCFTDFLLSLSLEDIKSGIGEMLHYYLIKDTSNAIDLMNHYDEIMVGNRSILLSHITNSLKIKIDIIEKDEFDTGIRKIFNYGHTFGHAIESLTQYKISHGQAVTLGIDIANYVSWKMNLIEEDLYWDLNRIIKKNIPTFSMNDYDIDTYMKYLSQDKKNVDNYIGCIFLKRKNRAELTMVENNKEFKNIISSYFKEATTSEYSKKQQI